MTTRSNSAYVDLMAFVHDTTALGQLAERTRWDQETFMPAGAIGQRADEIGALETVIHARRTDPRIGDWLASIDAEALDPVAQAQIRHIARDYDRTRRVPADLAIHIAKTMAKSHETWANARANEDVAAFLPTLQEVVALRRQEGEALADGGDVYDALVEEYEPHTTANDLAEMFDVMRPRLRDLRAAVRDAEAPKALQGGFDPAKQLELAHKLASAFGYDFNHGRLDEAVHPFSSGRGQDVRITTRTVESDPFNCFYSTIHEVGHACYELGIDPAYYMTPLGCGVSMGVHESQSRIYENQIGRSRAFTGWLFDQMKMSFGDFGIENKEDFYATANAVKDGFIRTEADELQYNLHVMLRFDLERALISGDLAVADLEAAWNDRFSADFGFAVDKPSNGVLQDVHWSVGYFGYFATYSLGNLYAGCLHAAMRRDLPDLDADLAQGDTSAATGWLRRALQQHGGLRMPRDTIAHATGEMPHAEPLLGYLESKFKDIYGL